MMMPVDTHAIVAPSNLHRIVDCPGSLKLSAKVYDKQSAYAREGDHLHKAIEKWLLDEWVGMAGTQELTDPEVDPAIVTPHLDKEQIIAIEECLIYLGQVLKTIDDPDAQIEIESKVHLLGYHSVLFDCWGTADIKIMTKDRIIIIDWKFGRGVIVFADENDQLYAYAAGAAENRIKLYQYDTVEIHVAQPRLDHFDSVVKTPADIEAWLDSRIVPGVARAYERHAPFNPGKEQCRFCPAKRRCRARHNFANQVAADVFAAHEKLPNEITIEEVVEIYNKSQAYIDYIKDLEKHIIHELQTGKPVPGKKIVSGRSIRTWKSEGEASIWLQQRFDPTEIYPPKMVSPAQAEKLDRKLKKDEDFQKLIIKPPGKATLVNESDPREALEYRTAAEIFEDIDNEEE